MVAVTGYRDLIRNLHEKCLGMSLAAYGISGGTLDTDGEEEDSESDSEDDLQIGKSKTGALACKTYNFSVSATLTSTSQTSFSETLLHWHFKSTNRRSDL